MGTDFWRTSYQLHHTGDSHGSHRRKPVMAATVAMSVDCKGKDVEELMRLFKEKTWSTAYQQNFGSRATTAPGMSRADHGGRMVDSKSAPRASSSVGNLRPSSV